MEALRDQVREELDAAGAADGAAEPAYVAFMQVHFPHDHEIVDGDLTDGNCHGLTFGNGGNDFIEIGSIAALLGRLGWAGNWVQDSTDNVLVCFQGDAIAHTARKAGGVWRQTLPDGPIFTSTKAVLDGHYTVCYDLSTPAGRQGLHDKQAALRKRLDDARARLRDLCGRDTVSDEAQYYQQSWLAEVDDLDLDTLAYRIEQMEDMLGL